MTGGLYLGGTQLPFISNLRVYLPREAYGAAEFASLEAMMHSEAGAISTDTNELTDSLARVSRAHPNPLPRMSEDRVRVLSMGEDTPLLYAPNQLLTRSVLGSSELFSGHMAQLAALVLSDDQWALELARASSSAPLAMPVQTRSSTWGIPFSWFILVYANDRMEVVELNGRILTVRIQVPVATAVGRVERTLAMLAQMAPDLDLYTELEDLGGWLSGFSSGTVELDYGPVANRVHPDDSPADVHMGLACLADGDFTGAAAAYRRLANRWMPIRQLARAN